MDNAIEMVEQELDPIMDQRVYLQVTAGAGVVIASVPLSAIKTVFQRGLNTWADAPPDLFKFSDSLDSLIQLPQ